MKIEKIEALDLFNEMDNKTQAAKEYCKRYGIKYNDVFRRRFARFIAKHQREDNYIRPSHEDSPVSTLSALKQDGTVMSIEEWCDFYKIPFQDVKRYKLISHSGKGAYYNISSDDIVNEKHLYDFKAEILKSIKELPNKPKTFKRKEKTNKEGHLLMLDPADVHIGKLSQGFETGSKYNERIAVRRVVEGVNGILNKSSGFNIDKILFVAGNDILHTDNHKRSTTSGTPQDTDGSWHSNFLMAKSLYIHILEELVKIADVHFVFNPSNHDFVNGFFLADIIQTYFKDCKNITFDCDLRHRKYFKYYNNLIGTTHGDGAKTKDLPLLMAHESKDWSTVKHRYIYTHHIHHKDAKDMIGVTIESLRSPSPADGWHDRNGYIGSPEAIEGFIHHKDFGQVARLTHIF